MPVFDALNNYASIKKPVNFIISAGDNIYPLNTSNPTREEVNEVINLFRERRHLNNRVIYTIRGNNDDRITHDFYKTFTALYPKWV
jgi:predicted phosphodiesterase